MKQKRKPHLQHILLLLLVSSALHHIQPAMAINADTIIITEEDIEAIMAHTMADILNTIPGVSAGRTSVNIHGNYRVKVFVDGRPLNDPTSNHGGVKWDMISPDRIKQIEILSGKGGVRYGQDASGGVILITSKGGRNFSGNIKTYVGSTDLFNGGGNIQSTSGPWTTHLSGGYERTDGYIINNDKHRRRTGANIAYLFNNQNNITLSADYLHDERGLSGLPARPTPFSRRKSWMATYTVQAEIHGVSSKTYYNQGRRHNRDISRKLDKSIRISNLGQELNSSLQTGAAFTLNYGGAFSFSRADGTGFHNQEESSISLYGVEAYSVDGNPFAFSLGLRANINSTFDNNVNPEIKTTWKNRQWRATLAYGRTSNTPGFYQRYNETSSTIPNPALNMETADNFSLSFTPKISAAVSGDIRIFYNQISNRITYITNDEGIGQYQNFGRVNYIGQDLTLIWRPSPTINFKSSYTHLKARDVNSGRFLPAKPEHRWRVTAGYLITDRLSTMVIFRATSKVYRNKDNSKSVAAYTLTDCKAEYNFDKFSLFAQLSNLFDKEYNYADGLRGAPRAWFIGINYKF